MNELTGAQKTEIGSYCALLLSQFGYDAMIEL
jgi:hypothetical protein